MQCDCNSQTCSKVYFYCKSDLLQKAIKYSFCTENLNEAMGKMNSNHNFYYAHNNISIKNGTYCMKKYERPLTRISKNIR